jgi:adenine-specific DNA-methyltransferase
VNNPDYLTKQIIAYIGNKRRLLHLIRRALDICIDGEFYGKSFLDLFAGSGIVSRLAKHLGFRVFCNDWEYFSYIINSAYIGIHKADMRSFYPSYGGVEGMIEHLNSLPGPEEEDMYISRYYSPPGEDIDTVDYRTQRLFYTRANGLAIDRIRAEIERLYPANPGSPESGRDGERGGGEREVRGGTCNMRDAARDGARGTQAGTRDVRHDMRDDVQRTCCGAGDPRRLQEKHLLLALLLYSSATHTNTSGVFKAYHKGFGGHNKDALTRILAPIRISPPVLCDSAFEPMVFMQDANRLVRGRELGGMEFDVVYLDPPYNQHQYGSNYHLLNTIARWDRPPVNMTEMKNDRLVDKAGIRKDWVETRSAYCSRRLAPAVFRDLLEGIRARHILVSYSTEGIIPFEQLYDICGTMGRVSLVTGEYTKYRGGRQSLNRLNDNIELVLVIDTDKPPHTGVSASVRDLLLRKRLFLQFRKRYKKALLAREFILDDASSAVVFRNNGSRLIIPSRGFFELQKPEPLPDMAPAEMDILIKKLQSCQCADRHEELEELLRIITARESEAGYFVKLIPRTLRKIAHKKYKKLFETWLDRITRLDRTHPQLYARINEKMREVKAVADKRFSG